MTFTSLSLRGVTTTKQSTTTLSLRGVTTTKQSIKGMTKKMSSLFDEALLIKIKGSHQKNKKALLVTSKCDIMKDILRTKKGGYPHVKTECQHLNSL